MASNVPLAPVTTRTLRFVGPQRWTLPSIPQTPAGLTAPSPGRALPPRTGHPTNTTATRHPNAPRTPKARHHHRWRAFPHPTDTSTLPRTPRIPGVPPGSPWAGRLSARKREGSVGTCWLERRYTGR